MESRENEIVFARRTKQTKKRKKGEEERRGCWKGGVCARMWEGRLKVEVEKRRRKPALP